MKSIILNRGEEAMTQDSFDFDKKHQPKRFKDDPDFDGAHYEPTLDKERLTTQLKAIHDCLSWVTWATVDELHETTGFPHASISAQLRNMRKDRFGGLPVVGRYRDGTRTFEYKLEEKINE